MPGLREVEFQQFLNAGFVFDQQNVCGHGFSPKSGLCNGAGVYDD
jgi:hypothetical protein